MGSTLIVNPGIMMSVMEAWKI